MEKGEEPQTPSSVPEDQAPANRGPDDFCEPGPWLDMVVLPLALTANATGWPKVGHPAQPGIVGSCRRGDW